VDIPDYAFDLASSSFPEKLFWMKGRFLFLAVVPVLWVVMIVPCPSIVLTTTNPVHYDGTAR